MTPKERRAQMMKARGKTETTGINPNSPLARRQKDLASKTKTKSITPKERRARDIASRGESSTKYSPMRAQRLRSKGIGTSGDTDTEFKGSVKNLTKKGMARKMENAKPKVTVGAPKAKVGPSRASKPSTKSKPGVGAKRVMAGLSEFGKAFAKARKAGKKDFTFRDKQYAAITKQEVQKAGASGLGDYLNKLKRKDSQIAKAPGQVTKKKGGMLKRAMGGSVNEEDLQRTVDRAKIIREARKSLKNKMNSPSYVESEEARRSIENSDRRKMNKDERREKFGFPKRPAPSAVGRARRGKARTLPLRPGMDLEPKRMPGKPGMRPEGRYLKEKSGAAVSENEMRSIMEQIGKPESRDKYAKGGSVKARGGRMGKQKPTKLY